MQLLGPEDEEAASSGQVHNGRIHTNVEGARGIRPAAVPAEISAQEQPGKDATKGVGLGQSPLIHCLAIFPEGATEKGLA